VFKCPNHIDKGEIEMTWTDFNTSAKGCPYCAGKHKTSSDLEKQIPDYIDVIGEYRGLYTEVKCRCRNCGWEWDALPSSLKKGLNCPNCLKLHGNKKRLSQPEFENKLYDVAPNIIVLSKYQGNHNIIHVKCSIHSCEWNSYPSNLLNKSAGCPMCRADRARERTMLTNEEFLESLYSIRSDVEPMEDYKGMHEPILCRCKEHKFEFYMDPVHLYRKQNTCPDCNKSVASFGERSIASYLDDNHIPYTTEKKFKDCKYIHALRFDFYIEQLNTCIEYDGEQHYRCVSIFNETEEDLLENQKRDAIKDAYCEQNGIKLIRIPYWEFENIQTILHTELCS